MLLFTIHIYQVNLGYFLFYQLQNLKQPPNTIDHLQIKQIAHIK